MRLERVPLAWLLAGTFVAITATAALWLVWPANGKRNLPGEAARLDRATEVPGVVSPGPANGPSGAPGIDHSGASPSVVTVESPGDDLYRYLVNGEPQVFIGMGYNPIYRHLSDDARAANYDRDFRILCEAGVNHVLGWDRDKGYDQDKFDELTLDHAQKYGMGVVMPFYLRPEGDYSDSAFRLALVNEAAAKINRFKGHPALRMWGLGNEVLLSGLPSLDLASFGEFYLQLADLFHALDPDHPVIYREAEDYFLPAIVEAIQASPQERPWLLYGMNIYSMELERILEDWPGYGLDRPLFVTEFGAEPEWMGGRAAGYVDMWRTIRAYPEYVMGGAPYVWTTEGPEPVDIKWGLMDGNARPVDDTFELLKEEWLKEEGAARRCPTYPTN